MPLPGGKASTRLSPSPADRVQLIMLIITIITIVVIIVIIINIIILVNYFS